MRFSNLFFLSFGSLAAGFSFSGLPTSATANSPSSATLVRNDGDPTSFSLLLRLVQQNGGSTIKTFQSEQGTSIPFTFTPEDTGSFIIEVISDLEPLSDTQQPDKIFASSSKFTVVAGNNNNNQSPPTTTSASDDTSSSSSSKSDVASATSPPTSQSTVGSNLKDITQTSSTGSTSSEQGSSNGSPNGSSSTISTTGPSSVTTSGSPSTTGGSGAQGNSAPASIPTLSSPGSDDGPSSNPSTFTASPGSTGTSNPIGAASHGSKTGMIVGIVFGVLAIIALSLAFLVAYMRNRRRKRTDAFERQLIFRQMGSSSFVFGNGAHSVSLEDGASPDSDMIERGRDPNNPVLSVYSQQSVPSQYSDSPSVFYTAVPRTVVPVGGAMSNNSQPPPTPPPNMPLPPVPIPTARGNALGLQAGSTATPPSGGSLSTLSLTSSSNSAPVPATAPPPLPQLAPGWVFPRNPEIRRSQLPPPKTDRQMNIHDRKVRLQGKLIGMQGWGNVHASEGERRDMEMLKEQIRRLEVLENSEWALGRSDELPPGLSL